MKRPPARPLPQPLRFVDAAHVRHHGRTLAYFGGCNYLALAQHPRVLAAMRQALGEGFVQPGASRATTGNHPAYTSVERALARLVRLPAAALLTSGYTAPIAAVHALREDISHVLLADDAHVCLHDAARIAGKTVFTFLSADPDALPALLRSLPKRSVPLVLTDGTRGTRAGSAPVARFLEQLPRNALLLVDDAHGIGSVGPGGRGCLAGLGVRDPRVILTASLAKALGVAGGMVAGDAGLIRKLQARAAAFVGTTSIPLANVAGVAEALRLLRAEPARLRHVQSLRRLLHARLQPTAPGTPTIVSCPDSPVMALHPANAAEAARLTRRLLAAGIHPPFIRYVSGPDTGFFRFAVNAAHTEPEVTRLADCLRSLKLRSLKLES